MLLYVHFHTKKQHHKTVQLRVVLTTWEKEGGRVAMLSASYVLLVGASQVNRMPECLFLEQGSASFTIELNELV